MADTIKDFLVGLGYRVDGGSERAFERSIRNATLQAQLLATTLEGLARKAAEAIAGVAKGYDQLHFASARTGASVQNIKALGYAFGQMGSSAGDAQSAIESFAKAARTNPGTKELLKNLGVANTGDPVTTMRSLAAKLQNTPHYIGAQYAGILGLSEEQLLLLKGGKLDEYLDEYAKTVKELGFDQKQASDKAYDFGRALGSLRMTVDILGEKLATDLMPPLTQFFKDTREWIIAHKDDIAQTLTNIGTAVKESAGHFMTLVRALKPTWEAFDETVKRLTGSNGMTVAFDLLGASLLLRVLAPLRLISIALLGLKAPAWLLGLLGAAGGTTAAAMAAGGAASVANSIAKGGLPAGVDPITGGSPDDNTMGGLSGPIKRAWQNRPGWLGGKGASGAGVDTAGSSAGNLTKLIEDVSKEAGIDPRIMQGIRAGESGHGSKYDVKDDAIESSWGPFQLNRRNGLGKQFEQETGLDVRDPRTIPAQARWVARYIAKGGSLRAWMGYRGPRDANPKWGDSGYVPEAPKAGRSGGNDVVGSAGAFKLAKTVKAASPGALGILGSPNSMRDFGSIGSPVGMADGGFTLNNVRMVHSTTVNVNGATDPTSTALTIGKHQDGINARALTHAQGAIR